MASYTLIGNQETVCLTDVSGNYLFDNPIEGPAIKVTLVKPHEVVCIKIVAMHCPGAPVVVDTGAGSFAVGPMDVCKTIVYCPNPGKWAVIEGNRSLCPTKQHGTKFSSDECGQFGRNISISLDGLTMAVGCDRGVYTFGRENYAAEWVLASAMITKDLAANMGKAVALAGNGKTIFITAPAMDDIVISKRASTKDAWGTPTSLKGKIPLLSEVKKKKVAPAAMAAPAAGEEPTIELVTPQAAISDHRFLGSAVAVSSEANTFAVSAPCEDDNSGTIWVYVKNSNPKNEAVAEPAPVAAAAAAAVESPVPDEEWIRQTIVNAESPGMLLGRSLVLSGSGNVMACTAHLDKENCDSVIVHERNRMGMWSQQYTFRSGEHIDNFGAIMAINTMGNVLVIGASDPAGTRFWINERDGDTWVTKLSGGSKNFKATAIAVSATGGVALACNKLFVRRDCGWMLECEFSFDKVEEPAAVAAPAEAVPEAAAAPIAEEKKKKVNHPIQVESINTDGGVIVIGHDSTITTFQ